MNPVRPSWIYDNDQADPAEVTMATLQRQLAHARGTVAVADRDIRMHCDMLSTLRATKALAQDRVDTLEQCIDMLDRVGFVGSVTLDEVG